MAVPDFVVSGRNFATPPDASPVSGPQPTAPGPYHAVVRGPDGMDISISGSALMVGSQLIVLGQQMAGRNHPAGPVHRSA
jgi:hypothetical protein